MRARQAVGCLALLCVGVAVMIATWRDPWLGLAGGLCVWALVFASHATKGVK